MIDDEAAAQVHEVRIRLHQAKFFFAEEIAVARFPVHVQRDDVRLLEQLTKAAAARIPASQHIGDVAEDNAHAGGFGQVRKLGADAPITDDAECQTADFVRTRGSLVPAAAMHLRVRGKHAPHQHDDLAQSNLRDRATVAVRVVEHSDAVLVAGCAIDPVHTDTEGADGKKVGCRFKDVFCDSRLRTDSENRNCVWRSFSSGSAVVVVSTSKPPSKRLWLACFRATAPSRPPRNLGTSNVKDCAATTGLGPTTASSCQSLKSCGGTPKASATRLKKAKRAVM